MSQGWGPGPGGAPTQNVNPYAPPANQYGPPNDWNEPPPNFAPEGNLVLGMVAGFLCGCIGLILVLIIAKGTQTKKGAWIGFAVQAVIGVVIRLMEASNHAY